MRLLLSISESPFDPTNGAARSMRTIAEFMAAVGHEVRCVATTVTKWDTPNIKPHHGNFRKVNYSLVDVDGTPPHAWRKDPEYENILDDWFDDTLKGWKPDLLLCYGGDPRDVARFNRARRAGVKIVFGLRNFGYVQNSQFLHAMDGIITSSQFLTDYYKRRIGIESTPLPLPIWPEDVMIAEKREPKYFAAINPTREKGSMILATVFQHLALQRRDIPLMLVGDGNTFDFTGSTLKTWQRNPVDIFAQTKVLLVPSVWEEPAGRVIAEAMLNGIPPIITDRGGMKEVANYGAIVIPLDQAVTVGQRTPVSLEVARPWIEAIIRLHDDADYYRQRREMAIQASQMYRNVGTLYEDYFGRILTGTPVPKSQLVNA